MASRIDQSLLINPVAETPTTKLKLVNQSDDLSLKETEITTKVTNLDDALKASGSCGFFQISRHFIIFFLSLPLSAQTLFMVFGGEEPSWRCSRNSTRCKIAGVIGKDSLFYESRCQYLKTDWEFVRPKRWSIVTEYNLVCEKQFVAYIAGSAFFMGAIPGGAVFGWMADRFGRKSVMFPTMFGVYLSSIVASVSDGILFFIVLRIFCGFCVSGFITSLVVISCEIVGPKYRPLSGIFLWNYFAVALLLLGLKAHLVEDWRQLELVTTLPYSFIFILLWFMPESMRWLWVIGKREKSEKVFRKIAKENKKPPVSLSGVPVTNVKLKHTRISITYILRSKTLIYETAVQGYAWFVQGVFYYAFFLISDNLSGDLFRDFMLTSLMEIPANFLSIYCAKRYGRKRTFLVSAFISFAISVTIAIMTIKEHVVIKYVRLVLGLVGKLFITNSVNALYVWSSEIYPTVFRSQIMGFFLALRPLGGAAAPWLTTWILGYHVSLPFALLSVLIGIELLLCLALPETKNKPMLDDYESATVVTQSSSEGFDGRKLFMLEKETVV